MLNKTLKYQLKAQAHALKPVILLGAKGLTEAVIKETDHMLSANELIKVKLTGVEREERIQVVEQLCETLHADFIQLIGKTATLYRLNPDKR